MRMLLKLLDRAEQIFIGVGLLAITFLLFANVVFRYAFSSTLTWAEEASRYGIVWIVFIGASVCVYKGAHITVDAVTAGLNDQNKRRLGIAANLFCIAFSIAFTLLSMRLTLRVFEFGQLSSTLGIPMIYVYGAMPAGGALMSMRFAQEAWKLFRGEVPAA